MTENPLSKYIIDKFGQKIYEKSINFPNNKISIIYLTENPFKVRALILDNEREFHLVINQKRAEIYHDCPSFLINDKFEDKICIHVIKIFLMIKESLALFLLPEIEDYSFTSEDIGSIKKSKNYLMLANRCFDSENSVEGLSYLNKALINQGECNSIIKQYFTSSINNGLFMEFFEFLKNGYENDLTELFIEYKKEIEVGFEKFLKIISKYSFFNLLRMIKSIDQIFKFSELSFVVSLVEKFVIMIESTNFNERYFSSYFFLRNEDKIKNYQGKFTQNQRDKFLDDVVSYFFEEIDNLCIIEKLKLMKDQFDVIKIPRERYYQAYKSYKEEIKELEKKNYLKKFNFIQLLIEKYGIKPSLGSFRKKRNTYIIIHDDENIKNPIYFYILSRIGFYGTQDQITKASDVGINYFLVKNLFLDDFLSFSDVMYYKNQFWGEFDDFNVDPIKGFSLLSKQFDYNYDIDQKYSNINEVMIIEWDLANKPIQGSIVNAYGSQIIIPDQKNPLFYDLKPFDLCYCQKTPTKIEGNIIKKINVITKCSFKDAIKSVAKGMDFIEGFYPLSLIKSILNKEINPFKAYEKVIENPNRVFIPHYVHFMEAFREFLFQFIKKEKNYIFDELRKEPEKNVNQLFKLFDLKHELDGIDLPYSKIIEKLFENDVSFIEFKSKFLEEIYAFVIDIFENAEIGSTIAFDLKKMKYTPFSKYSFKIISLRKIEFESANIIKHEDTYNLSEIINTYYGKKFAKILKLGLRLSVRPDLFTKIIEYSRKLKLRLNIIDNQAE